MTSWLPWNITPEKAHIAITAVISGTVAATAILSYQRVRRDINARQLKDSIPPSNSGDTTVHVINFFISYDNVTPLTDNTQLNNLKALNVKASSKEDAQVALLAKRARQGDYSEGKLKQRLHRPLLKRLIIVKSSYSSN